MHLVLTNLKELDFPNMDHNESLRIAELLLEDCKVLGAIPFSTIARLAFIGNILLKGLTKFNKIESSMIEGFMNSISTPLSEIRLDVKKLDGGNLPAVRLPLFASTASRYLGR